MSPLTIKIAIGAAIIIAFGGWIASVKYDAAQNALRAEAIKSYTRQEEIRNNAENAARDAGVAGSGSLLNSGRY